jgi:hypothetical protein
MYAGWPNYETWNVNLWGGNEEPTYRYIEEHKPYTATKAQRIALELWPNGTPDMHGPEDMDRVDWHEIAEAWNEE